MTKGYQVVLVTSKDIEILHDSEDYGSSLRFLRSASLRYNSTRNEFLHLEAQKSCGNFVRVIV